MRPTREIEADLEKNGLRPQSTIGEYYEVQRERARLLQEYIGALTRDGASPARIRLVEELLELARTVD